MTTTGILNEASRIVTHRGLPLPLKACQGKDNGRPVCVGCVICIAAGSKPGQITPPAREAMTALARHLGLASRDGVWDLTGPAGDIAAQLRAAGSPS